MEFTDNRYTPEEVQAFLDRKIADFGQVPCLEIDGHSLVEARAIERYLLTRNGTTTTTALDGYTNDSLISFLDDIRNIFAKFIYVEQNLEALGKWMQEDLPYYLAILNQKVKENNLFVNDQPQHADWAIFEFVYDIFLRGKNVEKTRPLVDAHAPKLVAFAEHFKSSNAALATYLASRPECDN